VEKTNIRAGGRQVAPWWRVRIALFVLGARVGDISYCERMLYDFRKQASAFVSG